MLIINNAKSHHHSRLVISTNYAMSHSSCFTLATTITTTFIYNFIRSIKMPEFHSRPKAYCTNFITNPLLISHHHILLHHSPAASIAPLLGLIAPHPAARIAPHPAARIAPHPAVRIAPHPVVLSDTADYFPVYCFPHPNLNIWH